MRPPLGPAMLHLGCLLLQVIITCNSTTSPSHLTHDVLGVLDWFWIYKLAGHVHCIWWRPPRTARPWFQPCFHVKPSY